PPLPTFGYMPVHTPLFPTTAVGAWLPEFLLQRFGTAGGSAFGFGMPGAPDLRFSPECPGSWQQCQTAGLPRPDHPLYSPSGSPPSADHRQSGHVAPDRPY